MIKFMLMVSEIDDQKERTENDLYRALSWPVLPREGEELSFGSVVGDSVHDVIDTRVESVEHYFEYEGLNDQRYIEVWATVNKCAFNHLKKSPGWNPDKDSVIREVAF